LIRYAKLQIFDAIDCSADTENNVGELCYHKFGYHMLIHPEYSVLTKTVPFPRGLL
jgi:hypothetical protein